MFACFGLPHVSKDRSRFTHAPCYLCWTEDVQQRRAWIKNSKSSMPTPHAQSRTIQSLPFFVQTKRKFLWCKNPGTLVDKLQGVAYNDCNAEDKRQDQRALACVSCTIMYAHAKKCRDPMQCPRVCCEECPSGQWKVTSCSLTRQLHRISRKLAKRFVACACVLSIPGTSSTLTETWLPRSGSSSRQPRCYG